MSRDTIDRLVLKFYPGAEILSQDQTFWYSEFYREFLHFMLGSELMSRTAQKPVVVLLRGSILGPRCFNFKKAVGLPDDTCVIVINLTLIEFLTQSLIAITFRTFENNGQEDYLKDTLVRTCQFSWANKFKDFEAAHTFLRNHKGFDELSIDGEALALVQSISSKIGNSIKQEAESIDGFEANWINTISNQYFSIIFHMVLAHEYGHRMTKSRELRGPRFDEVSSKARTSLKAVAVDARTSEEVLCDYLGYENLIFQQERFRVADWRLALATTWLEYFSHTAGLVFSNRSFGSPAERMTYKIDFFRKSSRPDVVSKCLHIANDLIGLRMFAFHPNVIAYRRLLQKAAKA